MLPNSLVGLDVSQHQHLIMALQGISAAESAALTSLAKRAFDVAAAIFLVLILAPAWLLAAALVKLTSPGPVIFRQERLGVGGRPFILYKFRTMHHGVPDAVHRDFVTNLIRAGSEVVAAHDASEQGPAYKLVGDARITSIGRVLRKTSFDEVPQLLNVLRGEMSLVGPRPPISYEVAHYEPWQLERLVVRPGITGLWQVSGRNRLNHDEMCRLDVQYIREWSMALDLWIVLRTPWVMFVDSGGAS